MRDQKVAAKRADFILLVGGGLFVVTFLAIFIPMLIHDMHSSPNNAQGGILGFVIGIPMALATAILGTAAAWQWAATRGLFAESSEMDKEEGRVDQ